MLEKLSCLGPMAMMDDFESYMALRPQDRAIKLMFHAYKLSLPALNNDVMELASQLAGGRLSLKYEQDKFPEIVCVRDDSKLWLMNRKSVAGACGQKGIGGVLLWSPTTECFLAAGNPCESILSSCQGPIFSIRLGMGGDIIVSGGQDGSVKKWDVRSGRLLLVITGHVGRVRSVDISKDGSIIYSAGADGTVRKWNAHTGVLLLTMEGHEKDKDEDVDGAVISV